MFVFGVGKLPKRFAIWLTVLVADLPGTGIKPPAVDCFATQVGQIRFDGLAAGQSASGIDLGASEAPIEPALIAEETGEA